MSTRAVDRERARAVVRAAARQAMARGRTLPADLRIWQLAGWEPGAAPPPPVAGGDGDTAGDDTAGGGVVGGDIACGGVPDRDVVGRGAVGSDTAGDDTAGGGVVGGDTGGRGVVGDEIGGGGFEGGDIAAVLERATSAAQRRASGLHVTPAWLADHLVERCLAHAGTDGAGDAGALPIVCDPACGGGSFLLAAARALHARGASRRHVVRNLLWGADVDPVGLAAAEVALALWAGEAPPPGRLVVGDALSSGLALWPEAGTAGGFGVVVGNPPFLNQLGRATTRSAEETEDLRARFGAAVRAYTDTAWLFLLLACDLVRAGGAVAMVQPLSVVAARDAAAVRTGLARKASLRELWVEDRVRPAFAASVHVCAPVLVTHQPPAIPDAERAWAELLADAAGTPAVHVDEGSVGLGTVAEVAAGFRDEYYGLVPLVREAGGSPRSGEAALITAGSLEWGRCNWGERPTRFAKRRWAAPVVDLSAVDSLDPGARSTRAVRRWIERTAGPKLLVATQTRVVELAVDERGAWVPSVPTLAVVPRRLSDLWLLAAAVASPTATAWLCRRAPGTALSRDALKIAARDLAALPLPADRAAWERAATALRCFAAMPDRHALTTYVEAAAEAYGAPPSLVAWWWDRAGPGIDSTRGVAQPLT